MISGSDHCARTVAVLSERRSGSGSDMRSPLDSVHGQERSHPRYREVRIAQQPCLIGEPEHIAEMQHATRALLAADHREMRLMAIEPSHEHDTGFVKARRRC